MCTNNNDSVYPSFVTNYIHLYSITLCNIFVQFIILWSINYYDSHNSTATSLISASNDI